MNRNIKLAVAGAVLAMSASAAHAGIVIPAGDWTLDVNGNVNAYAIFGKAKGSGTITGATFAGHAMTKDATGESNSVGINTGLLPAWLGFTGSTRQNDLDVGFTISMQPNVSDNSYSGDNKTPLFRQANLTFGDKSWGSIKLGKDIGIFASNAILNDMTLLGVGGGNAVSGGSTTLGGIGTGYIYAGWKGQMAYTTPNFNGFQATIGITNPQQGNASSGANSATAALYQDRFGLEAQANYSFASDALTGKVWVGGSSYKAKHAFITATSTAYEHTATAADIGLNLNAGNAGVTAYYYSGDGIGTTMHMNAATSASGKTRDSDGGYVQVTYKIPTGTKIGLAYGVSKLDLASDETSTTSSIVRENERMTIGAYHPLTKHLNLVAEYNNVEARSHSGLKNESNTGSLGAILFF